MDLQADHHKVYIVMNDCIFQSLEVVNPYVKVGGQFSRTGISGCYKS